MNVRGLMIAIAMMLLGVASVSAATPSFAVYLASMDTINTVLVFSGDANGMLTAATPPFVVTNGTGAGGVQSQHAIAVVGNYLFVCNPGSNQLSQFSINANNPTQITLVAIVTTSGDWPNSVGGYSSGNVVCVTLSGLLNNGIQCFSYTSTGMTAISTGQRMFAETLTTPPVSHTGPSQVSFTPDGTGLWTISKTPPSNITMPYRYYTVSISTGGSAVTLGSTPVMSASIGGVNFAGAFDPADSAFVTVDAANGVNVLTYSAGAISAAGYTADGGTAPCWIERSPNIGHFYAVNAGSATASEVSRSGNTITVVRQISTFTASTDLIIVSLGSQDYLFVSSGKAMMLYSYMLMSTAAMNMQNVTAMTVSMNAAGLAFKLTSTSAASGAVAPTIAALLAIIPALIAVALAL